MSIKYRPGPCGTRTALNITAATQVKTGQGLAFRLFVNTIPTAAGAIYDAASSAEATTANLICTIPTSASSPAINLGGVNFFNGLYVTPGTGGVVAIAYE